MDVNSTGTGASNSPFKEQPHTRELAMKRCTKCGIIKPLTDFYIEYWRVKTGTHRPDCKACVLKRSQTNAKNNHKKRAAQNKHWYEENKETAKATHKIYREKNKDKLRKYARDYYKKQYRENMQYRLKIVLRSRLRKAVNGRGKQEKTMAYVGCSPDQLIEHLESQFVDGMSWDNRGKWHIDHIIPLAAFNLANEEEIHKAMHYTNLQPLWAKDNRKKGARWFVDYNLNMPLQKPGEIWTIQF